MIKLRHSPKCNLKTGAGPGRPFCSCGKKEMDALEAREQGRPTKEKSRLKIPKPRELWMLWVPDINDFAIAVDDPRGHDAYLCAKNKAAALALAEHQQEGYDIEGIPIRVI